MAPSQRFSLQTVECVEQALASWSFKLKIGQEIAIRVFRTAHELAMHTVALFSYEDRMSAHRQKVRSQKTVAQITHL